MQNLQHFKTKLLALKDELSRRVSSINKDIKHEELSSNWAEQATERENDEVLESLGNTFEDELAMINQALKRIESGEYFTCSQCGEEISPDRLELLPYTTRCIKCAEKTD